MEHFKEYLPYLPFLVKTNNDPLTYIMTTLNLDATGYWWVGALKRFNFQLEYQKGCDNIIADVLSWITTPPWPRHGEVCPRWSNLGATHRVESHDPAVVESDHGMKKRYLLLQAGLLLQMHMSDWAEAQREDSVLHTILDWLEPWKSLIWRHS